MYCRDLLLDLGRPIQDPNQVMPGDVANVIRGMPAGAFNNGAVYAWVPECMAWGVHLQGDDEYVDFGNLVTACGHQKMWFHVTIYFDSLSGTQTIFRQYEGANNIFHMNIDSTDRIEGYWETGGNTCRVESVANTHNLGICTIDWLVDLSSVSGLQVFCNGVEVTYNLQEDPTGLSEIGNTGNFTFGRNVNSADGKIITAFVAGYLPDSTLITEAMGADQGILA